MVAGSIAETEIIESHRFRFLYADVMAMRAVKSTIVPFPHLLEA
jgi:hypothetical protein